MNDNERYIVVGKRPAFSPKFSIVKPAATAIFLGVSAVSAGLPNLALAQSYSFSSVQIEGLNTIEASTVLAYLGFGKGETLSAAQLNDAYQRLSGSGLFDKVELVPRGGTLVVKVTEFPLIGRINIEGNKKLKDDKLVALIDSRERRIYNPAVAERDAETIAEAYANEGRLAATVTPRIIRRPDNRVDLVFEVTEGKNTEIERITFTGNRAFSDARLRRVVSSKQAGLLRFLIKADTFDPNRLEFDKQLIKDFYTSRGYVDVDVVAVTSEVSPQEDAYYVSYQVREGQQFSFGQVTTVSEVDAVDAATLESKARIRTGATYDPSVVDQAVTRMEKELESQGLDFVRVDPVITRNERDGTLDIAFTVVRGPRIVVERIDIEGNATTLDRVVRNQFTTVEGDPFNPRAIRAAAERIRALGYFSNVDVQAREGTASDAVVVDVNVEEQGTGSFSFGGSYGLGVGFGIAASFNETNFLGRGQYLSLEFNGGLDRRNYAFSFAEPNLLGRDLRGGINAFYNDTTWQQASVGTGKFDSTQFAVTPSLEFPLSETSRFRVNVAYSGATMDTFATVADQAQSTILTDEILRGWQMGASAGFTYSYDSRRLGLMSPTNIFGKLSADVGGLGADNQYFRASGLANLTTSILHDEIEISATVEGGALVSISGNGSRMTDRFVMSPDQVLGFDSMGMGPRDTTVATNEALGGNFFAAARLEATFPIGLPEEYGIKGGVFAHAGSVWGLDKTGGGAIDDAFYLRASAGAELLWDTPVGPLRFSYAYPLMKQAYDVERRFGISISTGF